jgi:hypothetical protein
MEGGWRAIASRPHKKRSFGRPNGDVEAIARHLVRVAVAVRHTAGRVTAQKVPPTAPVLLLFRFEAVDVVYFRGTRPSCDREQREDVGTYARQVKLVLRNQAAAFLNWWEASQELDLVLRAQRWGEEIEQRDADVFARYFPRFGRRDDLPAALARFGADIQRIERAMHIAVGEVDALGERVAELFGVTDGTPVEVVIMVGLYGSNAWTIDVNGAPVSFLAPERLPKKRQTSKALIAHELSHAAHCLVRRGSWSGGIASKLVEEALAMRRRRHRAGFG